ncbi:MAG: hypothetical protein R2774_13425 [Saprospiraceae bacterium]
MTERILRYLDDEMSADDRSAFEEDLENDPALSEEYKILLASKKVSSKLLEAEIRDYFTKFDSESPAISKSSKTKIIITGIVLAALCVLGYFIISNIKKRPTHQPQVYALAYEAPIWPIVRGESDTLHKAIVLHLEGKTDMAIELLNKDRKLTEEEKYWIAEMFVDDDRCKEAIAMINMIDEKSMYAERIKYLTMYCEKR